jgi:hypothetical protein
MSRGGWHFGIVGLPSGPIEPPHGGQGYIQRAHAAGGFAFLAHPGEWNREPDQLAHLVDVAALDGIEILNGLRLAQVPGKGEPDAGSRRTIEAPARDCAAALPADATPLWDGLLARGYRLWGIANDDAHTWDGAADAYPFTAFDMVLAADPTPEGFLASLHAGSFYASTGLFFREIGARGDSVVAWAPGAERLRFVGWGGRILMEAGAEHATYHVTGDEGYVRVEAEGALVRGRTWTSRAWSQPFFLEPDTCGGGRRQASGPN